jgi:hypothetical protein
MVDIITDKINTPKKASTAEGVASLQYCERFFIDNHFYLQ